MNAKSTPVTLMHNVQILLAPSSVDAILVIQAQDFCVPVSLFMAGILLFVYDTTLNYIINLLVPVGLFKMLAIA